MKGIQKAPLLHLILLIASALSLFQALFRPFWFDEAITLLDFTRLPDIASIYRNYIIPNNHIVFTILLKAYLGFIPCWEPFVRLFPAFIALVSVLLAFEFWRKRTGDLSAFSILVLFIFSMGFQIYGTAVRGYMLSFLFILLSLEFAMRFCEFRKLTCLVGYFTCALLAVGTIPSNIAPLLAVPFVVLFETIPNYETRSPFLAELKKNKLILIFFIAPVLCLLIFYLPIFSKFIRAMSLKEGWTSPIDAAINFYGFILVTFAPLFIFLALTANIVKKQFSVLKFIVATFVLIIPLIIFFVKNPSPFPRTFFPYLPLILFLFAKFAEPGVKKIEAQLGLERSFKPILLCIMLIAVTISPIQIAFKSKLSGVFTSAGNQDDYFQPYFMDDFFNPIAAAKKVYDLLVSDREAIVFVDKRTDYPAFVFYASAIGISRERLFYDRPNGLPADVSSHRSLYTVVLPGTDINELKSRFQSSIVESIASSSKYEIYRCIR